MSWFTWLKNLIFGPPERDVSLLGHADGDIDAVAEVVDVSGGPLKEHHLRRALRDGRLLPKNRPLLRFGKRPRYMRADEAKRLFSTTMLTRDRRLRDLLPDVEQLQRLGLPVWKTEAEAAEALGLSEKELRSLSIHRAMARTSHYVTFARPKRDGSMRLIMAPKKRLKAVLRRLNELMVSRLPVSEHAHGFRPGRSVKTAAEPHVGRQLVVRFDIRSFFPSLHVGRVRGLLIAYGYGFVVATALAVLMTECERQPVALGEHVVHVPVSSRYCVQGAPTSPGLSNALFLRADRRLAGLARKLGVSYTRYADDLVFSGDAPEKYAQLHDNVSRILVDEGFVLNADKTRVMRVGGRQTVTGAVVNAVLGLSRQQRRLWRAGLHRLKHQDGGADTSRQVSQWRGRLAWLSMLNREQAASLARGLPDPDAARVGVGT